MEEKEESDILILMNLLRQSSTTTKINNIIFAYEPRWAIGTGKLPNFAELNKNINYINNLISKSKSKQTYKIIYGGSVNSDNAKSLIQTKGVDGFLIGGASLNAESFASIINIVEKAQET